MQIPDQPSHPPGKILDHGNGLGEASKEQVEVRARELAMIAGLTPEEVTYAHRYQARQELSGAIDPTIANDDDPSVSGLIEADDVPGESGGPVFPATNAAVHGDEQTIGEALYAEGVSEATHDQMVQSREEELRDVY